VRRFTAEGANLGIAARRNDRLDQIAEELGSARTLAVQVDVTDEQQVDVMAAAALERFGSIDVLVSDAGFGTATPFP
jgi:meso-butanediol dehydrogenase/(S,S)-butanediol dehydrogenase/diacetyl reductase